MSAAPPAPAPGVGIARIVAASSRGGILRSSPPSTRIATAKSASPTSGESRCHHTPAAVNRVAVFDDAGVAGVVIGRRDVTSASSASSRRSTSGCSCRKKCAWLPVFWPTRTLTRPAIGCAKASSSVRSSPTYKRRPAAQDRQVARERRALVVLSGGREVEVGMAAAEDAHLRQRPGESGQGFLGARQVRHVAVVHRQRPALVLDLEPGHVSETLRQRVVPARDQVLDLGRRAPRLQAVIAGDPRQRNALETRRQVAAPPGRRSRRRARPRPVAPAWRMWPLRAAPWRGAPPAPRGSRRSRSRAAAC